MRKDRFLWTSGEFSIAPCISCEYKHTTGATCKAFPADIPDAILMGKNDHRKPYRGDHGIQYKEIKK